MPSKIAKGLHEALAHARREKTGATETVYQRALIHCRQCNKDCVLAFPVECDIRTTTSAFDHMRCAHCNSGPYGLTMVRTPYEGEAP